MGKSTDYYDYVFRDGKLIGEFEDMYKNSSNVPWHQDEQVNWIDVRFTRELLRESAAYSEIHDIGCGTGHYLNLIGSNFLLKMEYFMDMTYPPLRARLLKLIFQVHSFPVMI